jgi:molybdopterin molybdotransferase
LRPRAPEEPTDFAVMIEVTAAERLIRENVRAMPAEPLPLAECLGRTLAEDVRAEREQPPFDRVTMDGIAVAYRDWADGRRTFEVAGTQAAGAPPLTLGGLNRCVEVMTGAMLPRGTDTVIPVERIERRGREAVVAASASVADRQFVHARGSDRAADSIVLAAGCRIGPAEIAVLAGAGRSIVHVATLPTVAVVSTGDELVDVGEPLAPHQIRSTNDRAIEGSLVQHRLARVTRARLHDDTATLVTALGALLERSDALILSGGVSMGQFDFVPAALERLGARGVFHKVRQRPGKPMWFGITPNGKPIFALPGNPVSTLICTTRYVLPALRAAAGLPAAAVERAELAGAVEASPELTYFVPVKLAWTEGATMAAEPCPTNTSGDFMALAGTDGFVEVPPKRGEHAAGTVARFFRW